MKFTFKENLEKIKKRAFFHLDKIPFYNSVIIKKPYANSDIRNTLYK